MLSLTRCALASLLLWTAAFGLERAPLRAQTAEALALIVGTLTPLTDIDTATLRRAFEGHPVDYASGKRLIPFNAVSGTREREVFDRAVLGLSPDEMARFWIDQRIRGATQQPRTLATQDLAVRVAASLPGAITYVSLRYVTPAVRVLTIDGHPLKSPSYLLTQD